MVVVDLADHLVIAAATVVLAWRMLRSIAARIIGAVVGILTAGLVREAIVTALTS